MEVLLNEAFLTTLLFGAVTAGVPLLLAGLGEQISEKAGVLNIGIEGMMLFGAYTGFVAAYYSNSFALGFLAGGLGGARWSRRVASSRSTSAPVTSTRPITTRVK